MWQYLILSSSLIPPLNLNDQENVIFIPQHLRFPSTPSVKRRHNNIQMSVIVVIQERHVADVVLYTHGKCMRDVTTRLCCCGNQTSNRNIDKSVVI